MHSIDRKIKTVMYSFSPEAEMTADIHSVDNMMAPITCDISIATPAWLLNLLVARPAVS